MRRALTLAALLVAACAGPGVTEVPPGRDRVTSVALTPDGVVPGAEAAEVAERFAAARRAELAAMLPDGLTASETKLFKRFDEAGAIWAATPLGGLDFSGVSWGGGSVATMITDRHALVSAHVPREVGSELRFVTRGGWPVERRVAAKAPVTLAEGPDLDLALLTLDAPVPGGVAVYPLAAMDEATATALRGEQAPLVVTHGGRRATIGTLAYASGGGTRLVLAKGSRALGLDEAVGHEAAWGDSSHPWFWVVAGRLVLAGHTHTNQGAGAGPNYADARVRGAIEEAVAAAEAAAAARSGG